MRSIVESSPVGMHIYRLDPDGRLVFTGANPAADRILGVDNRVFIGKTIEEAFPPLKDTEVPQRYRDVARSGKSWQTESIEYQDNAIKGAFEVHAFQTAPNTMVAAFEDITARKQSESALKQSEEKYRRLYNETPVLLHSIDRDARLVEVNDHWLQTLGYERHEVIGRKATDFFTEASRKYAQEVVQPAFFRDGMVNNVSYQFVKKNGDVVDVLLSATGERDAAGNVVRSRAVILDITERKRAEDTLRESNEKLQLLSRRLVESQETERRHIARELHDEVGQTLTVAEMNLQAAMQSSRAASLSRRLKESLQAVGRVLEQVRDLSLNLHPSVLDDLGLESALRWYTNRQAELSGLQAEFHADALEDRLEPMIETACFRVAQEALTNVVRHAHARKLSVELRRQNEHCHLIVRDDGAGFEVAALRERAVQGASLGLLSMEERATLVGGGLELKSAPGQGTEVHAWFPLRWRVPEA